jgi:hypothetical protein
VKDTIRALRPEIEKALAEIAKKHGLKELRTGSASYTDGGSFSIKIDGVIAGGLDKAAGLYVSRDAAFLGLPPLGTEFWNKGVSYKTVGLNTTGSKVIVETPTGKRFLFPPEVVKRLTAAKAAA